MSFFESILTSGASSIAISDPVPELTTALASASKVMNNVERRHKTYLVDVYYDAEIALVQTQLDNTSDEDEITNLTAQYYQLLEDKASAQASQYTATHAQTATLTTLISSVRSYVSSKSSTLQSQGSITGTVNRVESNKAILNGQVPPDPDAASKRVFKVTMVVVPDMENTINEMASYLTEQMNGIDVDNTLYASLTSYMETANSSMQTEFNDAKGVETSALSSLTSTLTNFAFASFVSASHSVATSDLISRFYDVPDIAAAEQDLLRAVTSAIAQLEGGDPAVPSPGAKPAPTVKAAGTQVMTTAEAQQAAIDLAAQGAEVKRLKKVVANIPATQGESAVTALGDNATDAEKAAARADAKINAMSSTSYASAYAEFKAAKQTYVDMVESFKGKFFN